MTFFNEIRRELARNYCTESISFFRFMRLLTTQKSWGIILIRLAARGNKIGSFLSQIIFHSEIASDVTLGSPLWMPHPYGIIMAKGTEIGDNCSIYQRTTFAEKHGVHKGPKVGNNCVIGAGSVLVGDIKVGNNVRIGPNSVVISDIEDNVIAFGNPLQTKVNQRTTNGY